MIKMQITELNVSNIVPNPFQPRETFDEEELVELAESMKEHGLINPISVKEKEDGTYELIAGERRWRASKLAKMETIYAVVKKVDDKEQRIESLIENIHRKDLNMIEKGRAMMQLFRKHGILMKSRDLKSHLRDIERGGELSTQSKRVFNVVKKIHNHPRVISRWLEVISADEEVIIDHLATPEEERVDDTTIARVATIDDKELQKKTYAKIKTQNLSQKKASEFVTGIKRLADKKPKLVKVALESELDISFVEQMSEEDEPEVEISKEEIEEIIQKIKASEERSAETLSKPIVQERYAHWNNHGVLMSLPSMCEKVFCPFCGKDGSHIRFTCHPDKTAEEILEQANQNHLDSTNRTEVNDIFADIVKERLAKLKAEKKDKKG